MPRHTWSSWPGVVCVLLLMFGLSVASLHAATAVVEMKDGKTLEGEIVSESETTIMLRIAGISTPLDKEDVKSIEYRLSPEEQFAQKREKIKDDDISGRYSLASDMVDAELYEMAIDELASLQKQPKASEDKRVDILLRVAKTRLKVKQEQQAAATAARPRKNGVQLPKRPVQDNKQPNKQAKPVGQIGKDFVMPDQVLDEDQINLLKVYEINLASEPKVRFDRDDLEEFLAKNSTVQGVPVGRDETRAFLRADGWRQLEVIFAAKARAYYGKAKVLTDPPVFQEFRKLHRTYVLNRCATNDCHGSNQGNFFLYNRSARLREEEQVYTNFYLLDSYESMKGFMIDRDLPERSLLFQYMLARDDARTPHPDVPRFSPVFKRANDPRSEDILNWIKSLYRPRPDYGINFKIEGLVNPAANADGSDASAGDAKPAGGGLN